MSEPLAEHLSRFTPDGSGLDRDGLLFAAGRASVRPRRRWPILAGLLTLSQTLTLFFLWPHTPTPEPNRMIETSRAADPLDVPLAAAGDPEPSSLRHLTGELDAPQPPSDKPMVPPDPPLHAFGALPDAAMN